MESRTSSVTSYLCSLLSLLERPDENETYSSNVHGLSSLPNLVQKAVPASKSNQHSHFNSGARQLQPWRPNSPSWILQNTHELYKVELLKKCILTKFQVFCVTKVEPTDLCQVCREISQATDLFNRHIAAQAHHSSSDRWMTQESTQLTFADLIETLVSCRSECIASKLLCSSNADDALSVARREALFIRSLVSTFNAHSSLLSECMAGEVTQDDTCSANSSHLTSEQPPHRFSSSSSSSMSQIYLDKGMLKRIELLVASELWKGVALCLRHKLQSKGYWEKDFVIAAAQILLGEQDLAAAAKCLQYVATTLAMEEEIMEWDKGFQMMLAASQKPAPNKKPSKPVEFLCNGVLPHLRNAIALADTEPGQPHQLTTSASIAHHVDLLNTCHHISTPIRISIHAIANMLIVSLELSLANWNMSKLARFIFVEAPRVCSSVHDVESEIQKVLPPLALFPVNSGEYLKERRIYTSYSTLQNTCCRMHDDLESMCVHFHDFLRDRFKQCIRSVFPSAKQWKAVGKRSSTHTSDPSTYCDVVVEQLITPIVDAALPLGERAQRAYMDMSVSILLNEYRRAIIQNKHIYRPPAGKQLLVDFRHLSQWLSSEKLGLSPTTVQSLSSLPVVTDMEQGLQLLCGTTSQRDSGAQAPRRDSSSSSSHIAWVRGLSSLSVWSEIAWYNSTDWQECHFIS